LWATQYYDLQPQQVKSELIYLTTGRVHPHQFSLEDLTKIGKSIVSDFEEMNKSYEIDYFDPHPDARNCPNCRFATVCPHSMTDE
jgi:CRISPR/Cas system-associated exonuclease Cas4 (RecB family)